jgi:hypothetical protein
VPRLDAPTLTIPTDSHGRLLGNPPTSAGLTGYRPSTLRRPVRRRFPALTPTVPAQAVGPGGDGVRLQGVPEVADQLMMPASILRSMTVRAPHLVPRFVMVDGQPMFRPEDVEEHTNRGRR